ncbi:hypothetical protein A2118_00910 [Candidatus Kaiserbacteria bacterium GWA2_50_9]|uniref:Uncharacterized protein n=1 Tax=Candidatus Kaiserbacteria bacterium GWA2_50_9 TaxID=1798474 RepID=A0A1F6BUU1_9BACT|nr:MAG: hypothetical protein A2118_00910 [Candidatus Kaiserbacteria bacterium GWA2_50_9]
MGAGDGATFSVLTFGARLVTVVGTDVSTRGAICSTTGVITGFVACVGEPEMTEAIAVKKATNDEKILSIG